MNREEIRKEYQELGYKSGTKNITIEIPIEFLKDFATKGLFAENKISEVFSRVLSEVDCGNVPSIGRYDRETLEMFKIAFTDVDIKDADKTLVRMPYIRDCDLNSTEDNTSATTTYHYTDK